MAHAFLRATFAVVRTYGVPKNEYVARRLRAPQTGPLHLVQRADNPLPNGQLEHASFSDLPASAAQGILFGRSEFVLFERNGKTV